MSIQNTVKDLRWNFLLKKYLAVASRRLYWQKAPPQIFDWILKG